MFVPTPEQIKDETAKIRAKWSADEEAKRLGASNTSPGIRVISTNGLNLVDVGNESRGWQYLTKPEATERGVHTKKLKEIVVPQEEIKERVTFQATQVQFGE